MNVLIDKEISPRWTEEKRDLLAAFPGRFVVWCDDTQLGRQFDGDCCWYRVTLDGAFCGFAWWEVTSDGRTELSICLNKQGQGVGSQILALLQVEAAAAGIKQFAGVVRAENPDARRVVAWLQRHGFSIHLPPGDRWTVEMALRAELNIDVIKDISPLAIEGS